MDLAAKLRDGAATGRRLAAVKLVPK